MSGRGARRAKRQGRAGVQTIGRFVTCPGCAKHVRYNLKDVQHANLGHFDTPCSFLACPRCRYEVAVEE